MNNPMSFNFFTASDKSELALGRNSASPLSSLLSQRLLPQRLELFCNAFLALPTQRWRCSSHAWHAGPLSENQIWKTNLFALLSVCSQNHRKPTNIPMELPNPYYRHMWALSKTKKIYSYIGCVNSCFHFTDGKQGQKECKIQCLAQDQTTSQNLMPVCEHPSITGYFARYWLCLHDCFSYSCCNMLKCLWQARALSPLPSWTV